MTENTTNQVQGVPPEDDPGPEHVEPTVKPFDVPAGAKAETGRYSAYDKTYGKYVGGVHDTKAKAREAAKAKGSTDVEIVEV